MASSRFAGSATRGFRFIGPVASFDNAEDYRAMARDHVAAITGFPDTSVFASFGLPRTLRE